MSRPAAPPERSFFDAPREAGGTSTMVLQLDRILFELGGLDEALAHTLETRYTPYTRPSAEGQRAMRVRLGLEPREYFFNPPEVPELNPILIACEGNLVRYLGYRVAGWFDLDAMEGQVLLAQGTYEPADRALENYIRVAVAWMAVTRGGMLVHAASAVRNDKGYLFFGESGAGKSTLSECNRRGRVISDDISVLLPGENGGLDVIGSPFRGTYEGGEPVVGRFPLAAGFRLIQAPEAAVHDVPRARALGELVGNLPFVAERFSDRPDLFEQVEQVLRPVPLAHLHFRKDDSYWDAIDQAGL